MIPNYLDILAKTINENWDQPALTDFYLTEDGTAQDTSRGSHYTYGEMYEEVVHVAEFLTRLGLHEGDHIAICGENSSHWAIAYLAIAKIKGIAVSIMHSFKPDQIVHMAEFSDAKALFIDNNIWSNIVKPSTTQLQNIISLEEWSVLDGIDIPISTIKRPVLSRKCYFSHVDPQSLALICFSSGSTGNVKGVMLPYRSLSANVGYLFDYYCNTVKHKNAILSLPLAHSFAFLNEFIKPLCVGMHVHIIKKIEGISVFVRCLQCIKPAYVDLVPKIFDIIMGTNIEVLREKNLQEIFVGGAGITKEIGARALSENLPLTIGYGATECGPIISASLPNQYRIGCAGKVLPTLNLLIAPNGEILVKGENVMLGYYKDPEATARKIDKDGWFHTGDKGHLDEDGYLYVEGRLEQDIIVLPNGENIHPEDIERKINALPEVKESIVLARDGKLVAIVVPQITNDQSPMTNTDLRRMIMRKVNPLLPLYSQLYDVEITDVPLQKTEKQTIKRYLYK